MNTKSKFALSAGIFIAVFLSTQYGDNGIPFLNLIADNNSNNVESQNNSNNNNNGLSSQSRTLRIGYFPNLNHAQAVIGLQQDGDFQKILNINSNNTTKNVEVESYVFNAGPSAIEALFGGQIDVAYVGPNPAINGYLASNGQGLRVISGAASGGASFVIRNDSGIKSVNDLGGKKFASPQLGNTQDVSLRKFLVDNGFNTADNGGNVTVVPVTPADILTLMLKKEIDGAWVPEPWATRLVKEANGRIFVDERELWPPDGRFVTANIIARTDYLNENPDIVKQFLQAHINKTIWLNENKDQEAITAFNGALKKITGKTIPDDEIRDALTRLEFTFDPVEESLFKIADNAYELGYLDNGGSRSDLSNIFDLTILNDILAGMGEKERK
ncbi:MAG TPA: aliphatic sulfonate ABC transporter substrate-binding protein [Nitrososphaeraceae archaeon]|jgi:NitT/TauT family transport system substrate-binding protein|nr:aliphatic sulfonate ABC transporter substrate-binding protein [Nitrososphaeraceae archaeon]